MIVILFIKIQLSIFLLLFLFQYAPKMHLRIRYGDAYPDPKKTHSKGVTQNWPKGASEDASPISGSIFVFSRGVLVIYKVH